MCPNDTRSLASNSLHGYDVNQADISEPMCSPSLVGAFRHAGLMKSVSRTAVEVEELWWRLEWSISVEEMVLHRLCLPVLWRAIRLLFHLSVHAFKQEVTAVIGPDSAVRAIHQD